MTGEIRASFDEDPSQTGRELLCKLQAAHPGSYPDAVLRTVQRRLKIWRGDMARALVFGLSPQAQPPMTSDALRNMEASRARGHPEPAEWA
ncbi:hypothetical protein [uncultured Jannaschia sp.]|uniref:hypothetical protein n=1 Tax=uncultured Jannaschia sp. TaxID=293347 RepID=UPI002620A285|nr:hypothetical protein [uncultured Jannaschia sp.]